MKVNFFNEIQIICITKKNHRFSVSSLFPVVLAFKRFIMIEAKSENVSMAFFACLKAYIFIF